MAVQVLIPPQVPSDNTGNVTRTTSHVAGAHHVTATYTVPKITNSGVAGSITVIDGKVTSYTPPT